MSSARSRSISPAVAGTDLFSHIRHMIYTVVPAYIIALGIFSFMGVKFAGGALDKQNIDLMLATMQSHFSIHPLLLLPPVFVILMVILKIPPLPALLGGTVLGGIFAMLTQARSLGDVLQAAHLGHISETGIIMVDDLLTRGGS